MLMQSATPLGALENAAEFLPRHIGIDAADEAHMLSVIGEASRRALIDPIVPRSIARTQAMDLPPVSYDEAGFRLALNEDAMATEKLAEGIRAFCADAVKLDALMQQH